MTQFVDKGRPVTLAERNALLFMQLEGYGHEIIRETSTQKIIDVRPAHADYDGHPDAMIEHFEAILFHAGEAHEIALALAEKAKTSPQVDEVKMMQNARIIRDKLIANTLAYIESCKGQWKQMKIEAVPTKDRKVVNLEDVRRQRENLKRMREEKQEWQTVFQEYGEQFREARVRLR